MKKEIAPKVTLRVKFFLICMAEFIAVVLLSELAGWLLKRWLGVTMDIPIFVWAILFSVVMGGAVTNYITHSFIDPITCLGKAMKEVAGGNFHVAMQSDSKLKEVRDIYESFNRMVKELGNTETLQTDFISSVSHEFKTPINAIEGYASLLQDHHQSPEEQETYIEKILFNTRRLSTLTGNSCCCPRSTTSLSGRSARHTVLTSRYGRPLWHWNRNGRRKTSTLMWSWTR